MNERRVYVHVGLEKAASTSLQSALDGARHLLRDAGIEVPVLGGRGVKNQRPLRHALAGDEAAWRATVEALQAASLGGAHTLILSGESLYRNPPQRLLALLEAAGWGKAKLTTFAIVRDPASWLNSDFAFASVHFRARGSFQRHVRRALRGGRMDWHAAFGPWIDESSFVAIALRARDDDRSPVDRALELMGLAGHVLPSDGQTAGQIAAPVNGQIVGWARNQAVDPRTVEAAHRLSRYGLYGSPRREAMTANQALLQNARRVGWTERFQGLTPALAREIDARCAASLDRFAGIVWDAPFAEVYALPPSDGLQSNEWRARRDRPAEAEIATLVTQMQRELGLARRRWIGWPW